MPRGTDWRLDRLCRLEREEASWRAETPAPIDPLDLLADHDDAIARSARELLEREDELDVSIAWLERQPPWPHGLLSGAVLARVLRLRRHGLSLKAISRHIDRSIEQTRMMLSQGCRRIRHHWRAQVAP
jgi:hypothetical protein